MKVLMLGWEYPPHIAGGLGMACEGLTKGLARVGADITFVVPHLMGGENAKHMHLVDPYEGLNGAAKSRAQNIGSLSRIGVPAALKPYWGENEYQEYLEELERRKSKGVEAALAGAGIAMKKKKSSNSCPLQHYGKDIFEEIARYTESIVSIIGDAEFDLIHAHDWMTYPAGIAIAEITGKPLVVHVHSVEYDRSGTSVDPRIYQVEKLGLRAATAVISVSHYTKAVVSREYGIPLDKIHVVHNGIYPKRLVKHYRIKREWPSKVVLFLGRITFQKGPDYFIRAAEKVIPHVPDVVFIMAGSGDLLPRVIEMTCELGINDHFRFPGFLKEKEVEEVFSAADLYVMPSVSEPFGLSALEAINYDTPAIISRQSGVSEVLGNALKFDYWDVDRLADLIINGLMHEDLRMDLVAKARKDLRKLRWDSSAAKTYEVYRQLA